MKYTPLLLLALLFTGPTACESPTDVCADPQSATIEVQKLVADYLTNRLELFRNQAEADCTMLGVREEWLTVGNTAWLLTVERWECEWCGEGTHPDGDF